VRHGLRGQREHGIAKFGLKRLSYPPEGNMKLPAHQIFNVAIIRSGRARGFGWWGNGEMRREGVQLLGKIVRNERDGVV
jgi:hypothetical protein